MSLSSVSSWDRDRMRYRSDACLLQGPHPSVHCTHDQDVLRLHLTVQQGCGGDLACNKIILFEHT